MEALLDRVAKAGYGVATGEADLVIRRMVDDNDARRLERAVRKTEDVLDINVNLTTGQGRIKYIPTIVNQAELRKVIKSIGFEVVDTSLDVEDAEQKARQVEIN